MRQYAAGVMLEAVPLLQEVVTAVVSNFIDDLAVSVAEFGDMRSVDDDLGAVGNRRFELVHPLGGGPNIVVHCGHDREDPPERLGHVGDMLFFRPFSRCFSWPPC